MYTQIFLGGHFMKHKRPKQFAAFLLSGALLASGTTGWLPSANQNSILNPFSTVVSADLSDNDWEQNQSERIYYRYTYNGILFSCYVNKPKS